MPDHPDQEQLAAYQAGDVDRRERLDVEAHLAACPSCAELVASVGHARGSLALLEEPDLPPGLHDRITAAVEAEAPEAGTDATRPVVDGLQSLRGAGSRNGSRRSRRERRLGSQRSPEAPGSRGAGEAESKARVLRPAAWYRRPAAWGAAAALLLAALVVPFLNQSAGNRTTAGGATGGGAAQEAAAPAPPAASNLPVFRVQGEVTADTVRKRLQTDPQARAAISGAVTPQATDQDGGAFRSSAKTSPSGTSTPGTATEAPADAQPSAPGPRPSSAGQALSPTPGTEAPSAGGQSPAAGAQRQSCLPAASATADPATRPLAPAFLIEGTYKGRPATVLVTTSTSQPDRVDLWVFPRGDCSQVLTTERVR